MNFNEAISIVTNSLLQTGININENEFDGLLVKKLTMSNVLGERSNSKQTHIALTGNQMDIFPYLRSESYFNSFTSEKELKKYFITEIPVILSLKNINYLKDIMVDNDKEIHTNTTVVRSLREDRSEQIQVSLIKYDGEDFSEFRHYIKANDYLIILKKKSSFVYYFFALKNEIESVEPEIKKLNNQFYFLRTETLVKTESFIMEESEGNQYSTDSKNRNQVNVNRLVGGENILFYGVPGSGKSHLINEEFGKDYEKTMRIVFHPDYMNTDFIGQILPVIENDNISYQFLPGPFTKILEKALNDPNNMYYLIIEEINRGNAPAIFGEIFQLLDRDESGQSKYKVNNFNIGKEIFNDGNQSIFIPSNLTILATMNTADQNVFTLDTAFQRRWAMRIVENKVENAIHSQMEILDTKTTWEKFNKIINNEILNNNISSLSSEDKRLGAYFITKAELMNKPGNDKRFAEKVIKYLWDDAFKFSRNQIFNPSNKSLEEVISGFLKEKGTNRFKIFNSQIQTLFES